MPGGYITPPTVDPPQDAGDAAPPPPKPEHEGRDAAVLLPQRVPHTPGVAWEGALLAAVSVAAALWALFYLFTRLGPGEVADLPSRQGILVELRRRPWSTVTELARAMRLHHTTVSYHLRVLRRARIVRCSGRALARRFAVAAEASAPPTPSSQAVVVRGTSGGPTRLSDLMRQIIRDLGYSRNGAWKAVRAAAAGGSIQLVRSGSGVWVHPVVNDGRQGIPRFN